MYLILRVILVLVVALINLFLAILSLRRNPQAQINKLYSAISLFFFFWCISLSLYEFPLVLDRLFWIKMTYAIATGFFHFTLLFTFEFPYPNPNKHKLLAYLFLAFYNLITWWMLFFTNYWVVEVAMDPVRGHQTILNPYGYIVWIILDWGLMAWLAINLIRKVKKADAVQKAQIHLFWVGFILFGIAVTIFDGIIPLVWHNTSLFYISTSSNLFFSLPVAFAILRYRFLDIKRVIARASSFVLMSLILFILYLGMIYLIARILRGVSLELEELGVYALLALTVTLSSYPIRKSIAKYTDRIFNRRNYETSDLLYVLTQQMASTIVLDELTSRVIEVIQAYLLLSKAAIFITDEKGDIQHVFRDFGEDYLYPTGRELRLLAKEEVMMVSGDIVQGELKEIMIRNGITVFLPLKTKNRRVGYFLLGEKKSGDIFYEKDLAVLKILSSQLAVALESAISYHTIKDLTIRLEEKVEERTTELKQSQKREMDLKNEFIFIATHDLRTPVVAIDGYLELIKDTPHRFSKDNQENFQALQEANVRLKQLVEDLLEVARGDSGTLKVKKEAVNVVEVLQDVIKEIKPNTRQNKLKIETRFDGRQMVIADRQRLTEVMENLLSNAVKFNKVGGRVDIITEARNGLLEISVTDDGYGIPQGEQKNVFDKFFKYRIDETMNIPGTGLGLFVAKMLIDKMGGQIGFTSHENEGTTFRISLPLMEKTEDPIENQLQVV